MKLLIMQYSPTYCYFVYIVPCWRYLLGLQTTPLNCLHSFIADSTRRYYNHSLQPILTP
jgi:hypothetical protein